MSWPATHVDMGNPHAVAFVDDEATLAGLDYRPPEHDVAAYPDGVNIELVVRRGEDHSRCASTSGDPGDAVVRDGRGRRLVAAAGGRPPASRRVDVPCRVPEGRFADLAGDHVLLAGPAEIVARGTTDLCSRRALFGLGSDPWTSPDPPPSSPGPRRASAPRCPALAAPGATVVIADVKAEKGRASPTRWRSLRPRRRHPAPPRSRCGRRRGLPRAVPGAGVLRRHRLGRAHRRPRRTTTRRTTWTPTRR